jgi:hypothetical protein
MIFLGGSGTAAVLFLSSTVFASSSDEYTRSTATRGGGCWQGETSTGIAMDEGRDMEYDWT